MGHQVIITNSYKKRKGREMERTPGEDGGRKWSDGSQVKKQQGLLAVLKAERGMGQILPQNPQKEPTLPTA